jgi:hypothetical protein
VRFRHLDFSASAAQPTPEEIKAIEEVLGARVPRDLKDFLRDANGATVPYGIEVSETDEFVFSTILCTQGYDDDDETFLGALASLRLRVKLPSRILPFAREAGSGSFAMLDLRPEGDGAVIAFVEDRPRPWMQAPFLRIADSLTDYIERLHRVEWWP